MGLGLHCHARLKCEGVQGPLKYQDSVVLPFVKSWKGRRIAPLGSVNKHCFHWIGEKVNVCQEGEPRWRNSTVFSVHLPWEPSIDKTWYYLQNIMRLQSGSSVAGSRPVVSALQCYLGAWSQIDPLPGCFLLFNKYLETYLQEFTLKYPYLYLFRNKKYVFWHSLDCVFSV